MKKFFFFLIALFFILPFTAYAYQDDALKEISSSMKSDIANLENALPDNIKEYLPDDFFESENTVLNPKGLDQSNFLDTVLDILLAGLPTILKYFASTLSVVLIASILNLMKKSFDQEAMQNAFTLCSSVCVSFSVFTGLSKILNSCTNYIQSICNAMTAFAPIMSSMYIMSGNISSAAVSNTGMMLFITILENFIVIAIVPIIKICACFSIIRSTNSDIDISGFSKILKNTFTGITVFTMSIFSFVMSYQSVLAQSNDSLSLRTARFAAGSFIPVIGGAVSDALKTVSSSLSLVKSSCGVIGIIIIAFITLPIIISLFLNKLCFDICAGVSKTLNCTSEATVIEEASSSCSFLLAIVSITCILFIFAITIFIKSDTGI